MSNGPAPGKRVPAQVRTILSNPTVLTVLLAFLGALVVFLIATEVFPYHSNNDDEAVYLQQAALLLSGKLGLTTEIPAAVRPWFFIVDGNTLYPKYSPVPSAIFALGMAVGMPRLSLAAIAGALVVLVSALSAEAYDRRTGVLAAAVLVATPFFLLDTSVFLPYAPTALFDFTFALAYVRAVRRDSLRYGALAGTAIGIAFFSRPYTAVLFAVPFVFHALYRFYRAIGARDGRALVRATKRYGVIGAFGLALVAVTLGYNRLITGSALVFPYQAFAPLDGLGFGYREILVYNREYTPETALLANWQVVFEFATRWTVAAPIGTVLAAIGVGVHLRSVRPIERARRAVARARGRAVDALTTPVGADGADRSPRGITAGRPSIRERLRAERDRLVGLRRDFERGSGTLPEGLSDGTIRNLLTGLFVSIIVGNVYFWGNLNVLAGLYNPTEGFISLYGPFYHFDLLAPLSTFGAVGVLVSLRRVRRSLANRFTGREARAIALAIFLVLVPVGAVAQVNTLDTPLSAHANHTDQYERAYSPFENREFDNALVFLPPIFGEWLGHPFQYLRNGPSIGGDVIYALSRSAGGDFAVIETYRNRSLYRYAFRGVWGTGNDVPVQPRLQRLRVANGTSPRVTTSLGVPNGSTSATVRLDAGFGSGRESIQYAVSDRLIDRLETANGSNHTLDVGWRFNADRARIAPDPAFNPISENRSVPLERSQPVSLSVTFLQEGGGTITYRYELSVATDERFVRVIWPPRVEICRGAIDCGTAGTYLSGIGTYPPGTSVNTTITGG